MALDNATIDSLRQQMIGGVLRLRFEGNGKWFEVGGKRLRGGLWSTEIQMSDGRKITKDVVSEAMAEQHFKDMCLALQAAWFA